MNTVEALLLGLFSTLCYVFYEIKLKQSYGFIITCPPHTQFFKYSHNFASQEEMYCFSIWEIHGMDPVCPACFSHKHTLYCSQVGPHAAHWTCSSPPQFYELTSMWLSTDIYLVCLLKLQTPVKIQSNPHLDWRVFLHPPRWAVQRPAKFFCKGPGSKYFWLSGTSGFCHNHSVLSQFCLMACNKL